MFSISQLSVAQQSGEDKSNCLLHKTLHILVASYVSPFCSISNRVSTTSHFVQEYRGHSGLLWFGSFVSSPHESNCVPQLYRMRPDMFFGNWFACQYVNQSFGQLKLGDLYPIVSAHICCHTTEWEHQPVSQRRFLKKPLGIIEFIPLTYQGWK